MFESAAAPADRCSMRPAAPATVLPPPLSSAPSTSELRRLLDGLRAMTGRSGGVPLPPAPLLQRRIWGATGRTAEPSLVRPFILAALDEHRG